MVSRGWRALKNAIAWPMVSAGDVVGNSTDSRSSGPLPAAQMNFEPPASIPPTRRIGLSLRQFPSQAGRCTIDGGQKPKTEMGFQYGGGYNVSKNSTRVLRTRIRDGVRAIY